MATPTMIYLVAASSGEYSDRKEWVVCAYGDREQAEAHVKALMAAVKAIPYRDYANGQSYQEWKEHPAWAAAKALDLHADQEASYCVVELGLWRHFDEFQGLD